MNSRLRQFVLYLATSAILSGLCLAEYKVNVGSFQRDEPGAQYVNVGADQTDNPQITPSQIIIITGDD